MIFSNNILNIATNVDITYSVLDISGKAIIKNSSKKQIDLTMVETGVYFLTINYEGQIFNKRIIKE